MPRPRRSRDRSVCIEEFSGLESRTLGLHSSAVNAFLLVISRACTDITLGTLIAAPVILDVLLRAYGIELFHEDAPLYKYLHTITAIQHLNPHLNHCLPIAWGLATQWEDLEPTEHRLPLPEAVMQAMVVFAHFRGWRRFAATILLAFYSIMRVGEALKALRRDLVLPQDVLQPYGARSMLRIIKAKPRGRGMGRQQHATVQGRDLAIYFAVAFGDLQRSDALYPFGMAAFRRRWDFSLHALGVPRRYGWTPACCRAGGAVAAYLAEVPITELMWRIRIQGLGALRHYLHEVAAATSMAELPSTARDSIHALSSLYPWMLNLVQLQYEAASRPSAQVS